jgi:uncharacterized membrane protein YhhN
MIAAVDASTWLLLVLFLAVAAVDWAAVHLRSKPAEYLAKPGCMVFLVLAALAIDPVDDGARTALVAALVLSVLGDVLLMLPGRQPDTPGPNLFVAGLASFLLAHVAYVVGFLLEGVEAGGLALGLVPVALVALTVGRRVVAAVRAGDEPELATPVTAYVAVISAMLLFAFGTGDARAMVGACLFAGSDSLIAWQRFVRPRPWGPVTIIVTYHLAQALLVVSFT